MRILIDATSARVGGGLIVVQSLVSALSRQIGQHEFHILLSSDYQTCLIDSLSKGVSVIDTRLAPDSLVRRFIYLQMKVPKILSNGHFDLLFSMSELGSVQSECPTVVLVHNNNFFTSLPRLPIQDHLTLKLYRLTRYPFVYLTLRKAKWLVFVSKAFRQDVARRMHLDLSKTSVIHHGLSDTFELSNVSVTEPLGPRKSPYLLAVSTIAPHKNYQTLLRAFSQFVELNNESPLDLVIAGDIGTTYQNTLLMQARSLGISDRICFLGRVDYSEMPSLYREAKAFIHSSRLESFGLPLIEAMASGIPVIASDLEVCREICGDAAQYFAPTEANLLAELITSLLRDPALRQSMISQGLLRARDFSWDGAARRFLRVFEQVA